MMMDATEKAVVNLKGRWPAENHKEWPVLGRYEDGSYGCWASGKALRAAHEVGYICTYPQFMEARKRLENKPEEWPEGANWLAQDSDGQWWFYERKPECRSMCFGDMVQYGGVGASRGHVFTDWRQSLERRPESEDWCEVGKKVLYRGLVCEIFKIDVDRGCFLGTGVWACRTELEPAPAPVRSGFDMASGPDETVTHTVTPEWVPGDGFPPGGFVCEGYIKADARTQHGPAGRWARGISRGTALASNGGWGGIFEDDAGVMHFIGACTHYRPIQSHRDKVIEAAEKTFFRYASSKQIGDYKRWQILNGLYDDGLLKLPEEE